MKNNFSVKLAQEGLWVTVDASTQRPTKSFKTKSEAIKEGRTIAKNGATVVVHDSSGGVNEVFLPNSKNSSAKILEARVKHRRSNAVVNVAIAKVMEKGRK